MAKFTFDPTSGRVISNGGGGNNGDKVGIWYIVKGAQLDTLRKFKNSDRVPSDANDRDVVRMYIDAALRQFITSEAARRKPAEAAPEVAAPEVKAEVKAEVKTPAPVKTPATAGKPSGKAS